ncbi:hypothetical protein BCEN4_740099 [Burkholderia cenocepacia]|nr:hypothetical protein BCEN4_740099 [Burkholderia cenocepacia]
MLTFFFASMQVFKSLCVLTTSSLLNLLSLAKLPCKSSNKLEVLGAKNGIANIKAAIPVQVIKVAARAISCFFMFAPVIVCICLI